MNSHGYSIKKNCVLSNIQEERSLFAYWVERKLRTVIYQKIISQFSKYVWHHLKFQDKSLINKHRDSSKFLWECTCLFWIKIIMMGKIHLLKMELGKHIMYTSLRCILFIGSEINTNKTFFLSVHKVFFDRYN